MSNASDSLHSFSFRYFKKLLLNAKHNAVRHPFINILGQAKFENILDIKQLRSAYITRYKGASTFEYMLADTVKKLEEQHLQPFALAVLNNLHDERGEQREGKGIKQPDLQQAHGKWRNDTSAALGVTLPTRGKSPLYRYDPDESVWKTMGRLVFIESIIPVEDTRMLALCKKLDPKAFGAPNQKKDTLSSQQEAACEYFANHIVHDTQDHLRWIMDALKDHWNILSPQDRKELIAGIEAAKDERLTLYSSMERQYAFSRVAQQIAEAPQQIMAYFCKTMTPAVGR